MAAVLSESVLDQFGPNDHFGQNYLISNWILAFVRPERTKMVHFGLKRSILVHLGPPTLLWPFLKPGGGVPKSEGFRFLLGKVLTVSWTPSGMFLVDPLDRLRKRKRTTREYPTKSGRFRGNWESGPRICPPPPREKITKIIRPEYFYVIIGGDYGKTM